MREDRRRRDGRLPPPRRPGDLRRPGAARAGLLVPLPAGRRPGQLRQHRRRSGRRLPLHRSPDDGVRQAPARRHRARHGGPAPQLFGRQGGAGRAAGGLPEPARQRRAGHRGRHGDLHPAPQHRRALRRGAPPRRASRGRRSGARRLRARAGFPDRRRLRRGRGLDRRKLPDRPRLLPAARPLGDRAGRARRLGGGRHRGPLRGAEVAADRAAGRGDQREEDAARRRRARRIGRGRARRHRAAKPLGRGRGDDGAPVPADGARGARAPQHERAGRRRRAARRRAEGSAAAVARPPPRRSGAPVAPPPGRDRAQARTAGRHADRLPQPRRGDPHRPRGGRPQGRAEAHLRPHGPAGRLRARHAAARPASPGRDAAPQGARQARQGAGRAARPRRQRRPAVALGRHPGAGGPQEIRPGHAAGQAPHELRPSAVFRRHAVDAELHRTRARDRGGQRQGLDPHAEGPRRRPRDPVLQGRRCAPPRLPGRDDGARRRAGDGRQGIHPRRRQASGRAGLRRAVAADGGHRRGRGRGGRDALRGRACASCWRRATGAASWPPWRTSWWGPARERP